jgi:uncharacterized radical SAM superfamily Fe-S cluster-containing enzyme
VSDANVLTGQGTESPVGTLDSITYRGAEKEEYKTHTGAAIRPIERGLPKIVESLCPECLRVIEARLYADEGKVWMAKKCPEHGPFKEIYWSDVEMYLEAENWFFGEGKGLINPQIADGKECPHSCGLCNEHVSHTALGNIDLTNRCNLNCPICFANSNKKGYIYEPSYEQIVSMLDVYRGLRPVAGRVVQFSGGEPTLHPRFFDIIRKANEMGFSHVQIASNGINLAKPEFAERAAEAGLHTVYLQFDGLNDEAYRKTRGRALSEVKLKAIENCRQNTIRIVFVPTIVRGINNSEVGEILKFAIQNVDVVSGISYQPVSFTGRIPQEERDAYRYTLPDLAKDIEAQTGLVRAKNDWLPLCCTSPFSKFFMAVRGHDTVNITCHPHCSLGTYIWINSDESDRIATATALPKFMDVRTMLTAMNDLAYETRKARFKSFKKISAFNKIRDAFSQKDAPPGLTFTKFLEPLNGLMDKSVGRGRNGRGTQWKALLVGGMHFMDRYNYQVDRVKRCVIHYSAPNGKLYPFCTYNSGPTFRDRIERSFSMTDEEWRAKNASPQRS